MLITATTTTLTERKPVGEIREGNKTLTMAMQASLETTRHCNKLHLLFYIHIY